MAIDPTPVSDYEDWGEEASMVWWQEVGRFAGDEYPETDEYEDD
jgi:hypothetical protein